MEKRVLPYVFSPLAEEDIISLRLFLMNRDEESAFPLIIERIKKSILLLRTFPELGMYREDFSANVLTVAKTRYNIVFRVKNKRLEILRIYHTSQKWEK